MTWPKWILLAFFALSVLSTVATIGKPRNATTPGLAVVSIVLTAVLAALVVTA